MKILRIGTRNSQLALWQAYHVRDRILALHPEIQVETVEILSEGDRTLDIPLHQAGGKGLFLKELEQALVSNEIDIAVHSMKDVTITMPEGLEIPVLCEREDPRDAFVSNHFDSLDEMPEGAVVGTCSLRRRSQIKSRYPHLELRNLRGNVNTRLAKLDAGEFDAIILACAGLIRLEMAPRIRQSIHPDICLPAVGQGVLGIQCRENDPVVKALIAPLNDLDSAVQVLAEREANGTLNGGCHAPVAVFAENVPANEGPRLRLRGMVGYEDCSRILQSEREGEYRVGSGLGRQLAEDLIAQGAREILAEMDA